MSLSPELEEQELNEASATVTPEAAREAERSEVTARLFAEIAETPGEVEQKRLRDEMDQLTLRTVTLRGHEIFFIDSGTGPVVLFIHGILGSRRNWARLIDRMHDEHRVIVPDLFGHGDSDKPLGGYSLGSQAAALRDLLDLLDIERVTLVGHSLGGGIAMQFYYLFPERVERLVLVASGGLGREVNLVLRSATLPGAEWILPAVASGWVRRGLDTTGRALWKMGWRPNSDIYPIWQGFRAMRDGESRRAFLATTRAVIDPGGQTVNAHDYLPDTVSIPTLVIWGSRDRIIPAWHAITAQQSIPGCRVELFKGAGHFPHLNDPDRFADVLRDFIAD